jgi:acyl dehydratase
LGFGRSYEDFEIGAVYRHWPGKTVTEYDHHLFCLLTMVRHPLHLDAHHARTATRHQQPLVIGSYIFALLLGLSEADVAGRAITHRGFDRIEHLAPLLHGDTLYAESEVLAKQDIPGRADRGLVEVQTRGHNQHATPIMTFTRKLVVPRTPEETQAGDPVRG